MFRIGCLIAGYLFGNVLTAEIVARLAAHKSAFEIGSGNPGTANITKQLGLKFGAIVLAGDIAKTALVCLMCAYVFFPAGAGEPACAGLLTPYFAGSRLVSGARLSAGSAAGYWLSLAPSAGILRFAWAGLGCTAGHNLPVWHRFKGGKGVATTCALLFLISPLWGTCAMLIGLAAVKIKKSLALGGILIPAAFLPFAALFFGAEITGVTALLTLFMIWRHYKSLKAELFS